MMEARDDKAAVPPILRPIKLGDSTAAPDAARFRMGTASAQQAAKPEGNLASEKPAGQEFGLRGQRAAREIKYSVWRKVCFKTPGTNLVCRTSIRGTFETGQSAVRIDLIEREGDKAARLQMFLPVDLYLQAGVKITIDQGPPTGFPTSGASPTPVLLPIWPIPN
jgi:invasion protein IalB